MSCAGVALDGQASPSLDDCAAFVVGWEFDADYPYEFDRQFVTLGRAGPAPRCGAPRGDPTASRWPACACP